MLHVSEITRTLLTLSHLPGVGTGTLNQALGRPGEAPIDPAAWGERHSRIAKALQSERALDEATGKAERSTEEAERAGDQILSPLDEAYPPLLAATVDRPVVLFVRGDLTPGRERSLALIGSRHPTKHGTIVAERMGSYFASQGWSITSGLALGIDTCGHRAALDSGGHTVAVLAHGLDTVAPASNRELAERIVAEGGALVSEYDYGTPASGGLFIARDRIQAGLSHGVLLIQTSPTGGSLYATRSALRYGRPVGFPCPTDADRAAAPSVVRGIITLCDGTDAEKLQMLECEPWALSLLHAIRSREQYPAFEESLLKDPAGPLDLFSA